MTDPTLLGLESLTPDKPVILTVQPAPDLQARYPRATVLTLPALGLWALVEGWALYLPLLQKDVTLWPLSAADEAILAQIAPALDLAGVRTLRWTDRADDDALQYAAIDVLWRDRAALR